MATKQELVSAIAKESGLTKKDASKALDATLQAIVGYLADGEDVNLIGFGKFEARQRAEKKGRNPKTKEEIIIPAHKVPAFKAGKRLKDAVNN